MDIKDSVVLITGAAQRVGRVVAINLAQHSAHIAFSHYIEDEPWRDTQQVIESHKASAYAMQADMTRHGAMYFVDGSRSLI